MSLAMTKVEREAFLAETRPGIFSVAEDGRGPLAVPVWYTYEPGGVVRLVTGRESRKARLLRGSGARASLCVQTEEAPYRYVTVEGPAVLGTPDLERDVRATALRYLGPQMGEAYLAMTAGDRDASVLVTLTPERWWSVDYRKMGGLG